MVIRFILIFLTLFTFAKDLNISKFKIGDKIDISCSKNGDILGFELIEKKLNINYQPKNKTITFNKVAKVINSKYGNIFIYDLSKNGLFLNAIFFDKIDIKGNLKEIKSIGIADENYLKKDDNVKLTLKNTILLKEISSKIDLTRVKYFIIISHLKKSPIQSITFKKDKIKIKKNMPLSVWAWHPKNIQIDKLRKYDFKNIYIQVKDGFVDAIKKLKNSNISIYGLNGSASDIFDYTHLKKDIKRLSQLKKQYPNIIGYQVDIEPYLLKNFQNKKDIYLEKYLKTLIALKEYAHKNGLKFSVAMPFWFSNLYLNFENIGFRVINIADETVLMSYRSNINKVIDISSTLLKYAQFKEKRVKLGLECMKIQDEFHKIFLVEKKSACLTKSGFNKECLTLKRIREYKALGKDISFFNQMYKLKKLHNYPVPYNSFDGFVLHYYSILP